MRGGGGGWGLGDVDAEADDCTGCSCYFGTSVTATLYNPDRAVRGEMLHREEAGGPRRLRQLPGPRLHEQGQLRPRGERGFRLLRPP